MLPVFNFLRKQLSIFVLFSLRSEGHGFDVDLGVQMDYITEYLWLIINRSAYVIGTTDYNDFAIFKISKDMPIYFTEAIFQLLLFLVVHLPFAYVS